MFYNYLFLLTTLYIFFIFFIKKNHLILFSLNINNLTFCFRLINHPRRKQKFCIIINFITNTNWHQEDCNCPCPGGCGSTNSKCSCHDDYDNCDNHHDYDGRYYCQSCGRILEHGPCGQIDDLCERCDKMHYNE